MSICVSDEYQISIGDHTGGVKKKLILYGEDESIFDLGAIKKKFEK